MGIILSCLDRNNHIKIDDISALIGNDLVLSKSLMYSWQSYYFKSNNKYLSDSVIDTYLLISNLCSVTNIRNLYHENPPLLPDDVIRLEILTRLPVKSLLRFQCVCKSWQTLILGEDPEFIKLHLLHTSRDPDNDYLIAKYHAVDKVYKINGHNPLLSKDKQLVGSVNGLVCLYRYDWYKFSIPCIGIWNPATNRYKDIPPPSAASYIRSTQCSLGFGFDPIANDYKVIYVTRIRNQPFVADVYSCNAGSWSNINVTSTFVSNGDLSPHATIVNGSLYWIESESRNGKHFMISFDISHEIFRLLPGPGSVYPSSRCGKMMNLRDFLAFIVYDHADPTWVCVYVFEETISSACGGGGWSKKYTVGPITFSESLRFFQCFRNGDLLFKDDRVFKLVCIDYETHEIKRLDNDFYPYDTFCLDLFAAYSFAYSETLVSIKGMNQMQDNREACNILFIER